MKSKLILLALTIFLCGCQAFTEEQKTNALSWQLKREKMKLDHLKELHRYKRMLEYECNIQKVDSLIVRFNRDYPINLYDEYTRAVMLYEDK